MADPVIIDITPADAWQKVATNVTTGFVHALTNPPSAYVHTYRDTGGAIPTLKTEGIVFDGITEQISSSVGIDVYVMALNADGKVRVDL